MNILILAQQFFPDSLGGSARVAFEQARELADRGFKVTAVVPKRTPTAKKKETIQGVQVRRYGTGHIHALGQSYVDVTQAADLLADVMKEVQPDAVIIHQPTIGHVYTKRYEGIPVLYMFHASVPKEVKFQGITGKGGWKRIFSWAFIKWLEDIETKTLRRSDRVLVLSEYSKKLVNRIYPFTKKRTLQIPTGIDAKRFIPTKAKNIIRSIIGIPEDRFVLLTVRRLVPRMGLKNFIKAVKQLAPDYPNLKVYIVGDGPLKEPLEKLIKRMDLEDTITLTGRVKEEDLHMFYQASDCFVLSTRAYEGLGIATLEALSSGLPVLGTPVGATSEILSKLDKRLLFDSSQPEAIEKGIRWFIETGVNVKNLPKKARDLVCEEYTWTRAGDTLKKIITDEVKS